MTIDMSVIQEFGAPLIAASLLPLSIWLFSFLIPRARNWGLLDRPGGRHMHAMPIAVVGGIGVIATWLAGLLAMMLLAPDWAHAHFQEIAVTAGCAFAVLVIGLIDDSVGITPRARILAELVIATVTVALVPSVRAFCADISGYIGLVAYPLSVVGIAGVMNAMNLVDGLDGLAGSMFLSISVAIAMLASPFGHDPAVGSVTPLFLVPGLLAFLRKNWSPAAAFMGDHGSLAVGYLLVTSALGIRGHGAAHGLADICMLAALFSYPVLDMLICMVRRLRSGQPVATGDRNHMHHRMLRLGLSARESVVGLVAWQLAMLMPVFMVHVLPLSWTPLALLASLLVAGERLLLLGRVEGARLRQYQSRIAGLYKRRGLPPVDSAFVRARIHIELRPMIEAAQFEERGCLEQMIESLRFYCERKVKGHGYVELAHSVLVVSLVGGAGAGAPTPEELRREWGEALKEFSQAFGLTFSTWTLPVSVRTATQQVAGVGDDDDDDDAIEAA